MYFDILNKKGIQLNAAKILLNLSGFTTYGIAPTKTNEIRRDMILWGAIQCLLYLQKYSKVQTILELLKSISIKSQLNHDEINEILSAAKKLDHKKKSMPDLLKPNEKGTSERSTSNGRKEETQEKADELSDFVRKNLNWGLLEEYLETEENIGGKLDQIKKDSIFVKQAKKPLSKVFST